MNYHIRPITTGYPITNSDERFWVTPENQAPFEVRSWDYKTIYENPGLYEAIYLEFYHNETHRKSIDHFCTIRSEFDDTTRLRVFDYAAGVGLVGQELVKRGLVKTLIGMDKLEEAKARACSDKLTPYSHYLVGDLATPETNVHNLLQGQQFNTIFCLSAVGTGDADKACMANLASLLESGGWLVFNVRAETTEDQREIIETLAQSGTLVHDSTIFHRELLNGKRVYFRVLIMRKA